MDVKLFISSLAISAIILSSASAYAFRDSCLHDEYFPICLDIYGSGGGGGGSNPFDQDLNTTDDVTFNNVTASNLKTASTSYIYTDVVGTHAVVNGVEKMRLGTGLYNTEFHSTAGLHFTAETDEIISIETDGSSGRMEIGSPGGTGNYITITDGDMQFMGDADYIVTPGYAKYFARYGGAGATNIGIQFDDLVDLAIEVIDINGNSMTKWYVAGSPPSIYFPVKVRADDYYSGDDSQGITNTTGYWLCTASDCSTTCQVSIKDGLITGCT